VVGYFEGSSRAECHAKLNNFMAFHIVNASPDVLYDSPDTNPQAYRMSRNLIGLQTLQSKSKRSSRIEIECDHQSVIGESFCTLL